MSSRRAGVAAVGVLGLVVLVDFASRAHLFGESVPAVSEASARAVLDGVVYLIIALGLLTVALVIWALWPDGSERGPLPKRPGIWRSLAPLAVGMVLALLFSRFQQGAFRRLSPAPAAGTGAAAPSASPAAAAAQGAGLDLAALTVVLALLAFIAGIVALRLLARRRGRRVASQRLARDMEVALTEALDEMEDEPDPRRAVIAAYARMERVLAVHGHPRHPAEAPFEYVGRVLAEISLDPDAVRGLAGLFERAKFSTHDIDAPMKAEAIGALTAVRERLQAIRESEADAAGAQRLASA